MYTISNFGKAKQKMFLFVVLILTSNQWLCVYSPYKIVPNNVEEKTLQKTQGETKQWCGSVLERDFGPPHLRPPPKIA